MTLLAFPPSSIIKGSGSPSDGDVLTYDSGTQHGAWETPSTPDLSAYAPLSGAAFTGDVTVGKAAGNAELRIDAGTGGGIPILRFSSLGSPTWTIYQNSGGGLGVGRYAHADALTFDSSDNASLAANLAVTGSLRAPEVVGSEIKAVDASVYITSNKLGIGNLASIAFSPDAYGFSPPDFRLRRTGTKTGTFDDGSGGAANLAVTGAGTFGGVVSNVSASGDQVYFSGKDGGATLVNIVRNSGSVNTRVETYGHLALLPGQNTTGFVGINTASPSQMLTVKDGNLLIEESGSSDRRISVRRSSQFNNLGGLLFEGGTGDIVFESRAWGSDTAPAEIMRVTTAGALAVTGAGTFGGDVSTTGTATAFRCVNSAAGLTSIYAAGGGAYPTIGFNAFKSATNDYEAAVSGMQGIWQFDTTSGDLIYYTDTATTAGSNMTPVSRVTISVSGAASFASLNLGGATVLDVLSATAVIDFGEVASLGTVESTITVTGAAVGDSVVIAVPTTTDPGMVVQGIVISADTVLIRATNASVDPIDLASGTYRATCIRI